MRIALIAYVFASLSSFPSTSLAVADSFDQYSAAYRNAYQATDPSKVGHFRPGSPEEQKALSQFSLFFSSLTPDSVRGLLRGVYASDVYFNDTLKEIQGLDALEPYLLRSAEAVDSCTVNILDVASNKGEYYVRWAMHIRFKKFKRGETQTSIGMTHLRFNQDGKVSFHQDYWDASSNLFEKIPVLGAAIRMVKRRI